MLAGPSNEKQGGPRVNLGWVGNGSGTGPLENVLGFRWGFGGWGDSSGRARWCHRTRPRQQLSRTSQSCAAVSSQRAEATSNRRRGWSTIRHGTPLTSWSAGQMRTTAAKNSRKSIFLLAAAAQGAHS